MAAFSERRLVWSATLVIVVTTWLMPPAFSLSTPSLALIDAAASMTWRIVSSMRVTPACPLPARVADSSATVDTSFIVLTSSLEVAEICFEVAPISVVVAAISAAVACCCLAVPAISFTDVLTSSPERWTSPTSDDNRFTILASA
jgi:hypothetical protein